MNVIALPIGLEQHLLPGEVREDAQFDLRVVRTQQRPVVLGKESLADPAAVLGAYRNVLKVGIAAA